MDGLWKKLFSPNVEERRPMASDGPLRPDEKGGGEEEVGSVPDVTLGTESSVEALSPRSPSPTAIAQHVSESRPPLIENEGDAVSIFLETSLEDEKRRSIFSLREISRSELISSASVKVLVAALHAQEFHDDGEVLVSALEALVNSVTPGNGSKVSQAIVAANINVFISERGHFDLLLSLLAHEELFVRYNTVQLIALLCNSEQRIAVQQALLQNVGVVRLVDLLSDSREIIRNEGVLLLTALVHEDEALQKIVAFQGVFELCCGMIEEEGGSSGSVVVMDYVRLLLELLKKNASNQNHFRETNCIPRLDSLMRLSDEVLSMETLPELVEQIVGLSIELLPCFLEQMEGEKDDARIRQNKLAIHSGGLVDRLLFIVVGPVRAPNLRLAAYAPLVRTIRGCSPAQHYIAVRLHPVGDVFVPVLATLLLRALTPIPVGEAAAGTGSSVVEERSLSLSFIEAFLFENPSAHLAWARTFCAPPSESVRLGRLLYERLIPSSEIPTMTVAQKASEIWTTLVVVRYLLQGSISVKSLLLSLPLELNGTRTLFALLCAHLETCVNEKCLLLPPESQPLIHVHSIMIGVLLVLVTWCEDCPALAWALASAPSSVDLLLRLIQGGNRSLVSTHVQALGCLLLGICLEFVGSVVIGDEGGNEEDLGFTCGGEAVVLLPSPRASSDKDLRDVENKLYSLLETVGVEDFMGKVAAIVHTDAFQLAEQSPESVDPAHDLFDSFFCGLYTRVVARVKRRVVAIKAAPRNLESAEGEQDERVKEKEKEQENDLQQEVASELSRTISPVLVDDRKIEAESSPNTSVLQRPDGRILELETECSLLRDRLLAAEERERQHNLRNQEQDELLGIVRTRVRDVEQELDRYVARVRELEGEVEHLIREKSKAVFPPRTDSEETYKTKMIELERERDGLTVSMQAREEAYKKLHEEYTDLLVMLSEYTSEGVEEI